MASFGLTTWVAGTLIWVASTQQANNDDPFSGGWLSLVVDVVDAVDATSRGWSNSSAVESSCPLNHVLLELEMEQYCTVDMIVCLCWGN
jgi:hypothetical protein